MSGLMVEDNMKAFQWFLDFTTISGIGQVVASKEKTWRFFWSILTFGCFIMTFYQVVNVVNGYLEFDVATKLSINGEDTMELPSVSICNNNRIHCGNLFNMILEYDLTDNVSSKH